MSRTYLVASVAEQQVYFHMRQHLMSRYVSVTLSLDDVTLQGAGSFPGVPVATLSSLSFHSAPFYRPFPRLPFIFPDNVSSLPPQQSSDNTEGSGRELSNCFCRS